jgi:NADPH2:quinone reductase
VTLDLPVGQRVIVRELAEDPRSAIDTNLALEPMPPPDPATLAPHDVVVAVKSASVGWVDLIMVSGQYQHLLQPPYTPGLEYAGVAVWVGPEAAARVSVGDAVLVDGLVSGPRSLGAYQRWGGWASYAVAPATAVHRIPGGLSFAEACNLLGSYETAYHALVARGRIVAGETVLVHGASGSTGLAAVHVAKLLGATVIATGRSPAKLAVVAQEGADHVVAVDATDEASLRTLRDRVKELTGGAGVDLVYDGVGGPISAESLRCVRFGARYLVVGWAATPAVAEGRGRRGAPNANVLPTNLILMKGLDVLGCPAAISIAKDPASRVTRFDTIWQWAITGRIKPRVSHTFPLAEFATAMRAKWAGEVVGGCVVTPPDTVLNGSR